MLTALTDSQHQKKCGGFTYEDDIEPFSSEKRKSCLNCGWMIYLKFDPVEVRYNPHRADRVISRRGLELQECAADSCNLKVATHVNTFCSMQCRAAGQKYLKQ